MTETYKELPTRIIEELYLAILDAYERLPDGKANLKRCLNYLETECFCEPPEGYVKKDALDLLSIQERKKDLIGVMKAVRKPITSIAGDEP